MAGELILVVDDDPAIIEVLRCTLHCIGYAVATADHGAALPLAHERQSHVILLAPTSSRWTTTIVAA